MTGPDRESAELVERLVSCLPAATFELETLCRLAGVVASREVETAAVECRARPRMLVNPDFVREYCRRDEHVFLLVVHESWHVILAHTRLYPRPTEAHNVAFDAVINAGLAREHPGPEYRGFFEAINAADSFPALLLRPPEGWPGRPAYPQVGPEGTRTLLERLYPAGNPDNGDMPLYEEILALLERGGRRSGAFLLGDHSDPVAEERALDDPLFGGVVRRIVASWPPPPFPLGGRDAGTSARDWRAVIGSTSDEARTAFARVLRRTRARSPGASTRRARAQVPTIAGLGVLPTSLDRLAPARRRSVRRRRCGRNRRSRGHACASDPHWRTSTSMSPARCASSSRTSVVFSCPTPRPGSRASSSSRPRWRRCRSRSSGGVS